MALLGKHVPEDSEFSCRVSINDSLILYVRTPKTCKWHYFCHGVTLYYYTMRNAAIAHTLITPRSYQSQTASDFMHKALSYLKTYTCILVFNQIRTKKLVVYSKGILLTTPFPFDPTLPSFNTDSLHTSPPIALFYIPQRASISIFSLRPSTSSFAAQFLIPFTQVKYSKQSQINPKHRAPFSPPANLPYSLLVQYFSLPLQYLFASILHSCHRHKEPVR